MFFMIFKQQIFSQKFAHMSLFPDNDDISCNTNNPKRGSGLLHSIFIRGNKPSYGHNTYQ